MTKLLCVCVCLCMCARVFACSSQCECPDPHQVVRVEPEETAVFRRKLSKPISDAYKSNGRTIGRCVFYAVRVVSICSEMEVDY
jgi:hypothetical protein